MCPNIFCRKALVDDILEKCKKWEYNPLFDFHKKISSDEADMYLENMHNTEYRNKEILPKQIKQTMLSAIFTHYPILKLLSFSNASIDISASDSIDAKRKEYTEKFESLFDKDFYAIEDDNISRELSNQRMKDIFCKIYRFLSMKLFNEETLQAWDTCISMDYSSNEYLSKMVLSFLEVEKINFFDEKQKEFYDGEARKKRIAYVIDLVKEAILNNIK